MKQLVYKYDVYNNLRLILDDDGHVITEYETHYKTNSNDHDYLKTVIPDDKKAMFNYFDGYGRSEQSIALDPDGDIIAFHKYDASGREVASYLPYTANNTNGDFQTDAESDQAAFYQVGSSTTHATSDYPYAKVITDKSPLNRVLQSGSAGDEWQPGNGHSVKNDLKNIDGSWLRIWKINESTGGGATADNLYDVYSCIQSSVTDENGHVSDVFADRLGHTICKRTTVTTE